MEQQVGHSEHRDVRHHREGIPARTHTHKTDSHTQFAEGPEDDHTVSAGVFRCLCVCARWRAPPVGGELHLGVLAADQLWDEGQVGDLRGGPAELEDDDKGHEVGEAGPLRGVGAAAQTLVEDEGEGEQHAHRPCSTRTHTRTLQ